MDNVDNEDELLYGDVPNFKMPPPVQMKVNEPSTKRTPTYVHKSSFQNDHSNCILINDQINICFFFSWQKYFQDVKPTYWLFAYRDNGTLEIYSLPDLRLSYLIKNFGYGQSVMHDSMESTTVQSYQVNEIPNPEIQVREILMVALGHQSSRPLLLLRLDGEIQIYEVYRYPKGHLKLRFKKVDHGIITGSTV